MSSVRRVLVFWLGLRYKYTLQLCRVAPLHLRPEELSFTLSTLGGDQHLVWCDGARTAHHVFL